MTPRTWTSIGLAAGAVLLATVGRAAGAASVLFTAGLLAIAAIVVAIAPRLNLAIPAHLFPARPANARWCVGCGTFRPETEHTCQNCSHQHKKRPAPRPKSKHS